MFLLGQLLHQSLATKEILANEIILFFSVGNFVGFVIINESHDLSFKEITKRSSVKMWVKVFYICKPAHKHLYDAFVAFFIFVVLCSLAKTKRSEFTSVSHPLSKYSFILLS